MVLLDLLKQQKLKPVVAQRFSFADARKAHEMLAGGGVIGKIVLVAESGPTESEPRSAETILESQ